MMILLCFAISCFFDEPPIVKCRATLAMSVLNKTSDTSRVMLFYQKDQYHNIDTTNFSDTINMILAPNNIKTSNVIFDWNEQVECQLHVCSNSSDTFSYGCTDGQITGLFIVVQTLFKDTLYSKSHYFMDENEFAVKTNNAYEFVTQDHGTYKSSFIKLCSNPGCSVEIADTVLIQ